MAGPLEGLLVLDLTRVLAGPHSAQALAQLGADVVKIEPPEGDITRYAVPRANSLAYYHVQQNSGKRNISLDLRREEGREIVLRLATRADIFLENFRPGVTDRLGIGYDVLARVNPKLIYGAISGYGTLQGWRDRRAYARVMHAEMGLLLGDADLQERPPAHTTFSHGDLYAALELTIGVLAALEARNRTGLGTRVDVSMAQTLLYVNEYAAIDVSGVRDDEDLGPVGRGRDPIFELANGEVVTITGTPTTPAAFVAYSQAIGPELATDPRFATYEGRRDHREAYLDIIGRWVARFDSFEAFEEKLATVGLPVGLARRTADVATTAWAQDNDAFVTIERPGGKPMQVPAPPWIYSTTGRAEAEPIAAYRGEHNREVLRGILGMDDSAIDELEQGGVLSSRVPSS